MTLASEPKTLSPDAAELAGGKTLAKKKSVMGRLKSKISTTLGRKKSLTDMSPTDKDVVKTTSASAAKMQQQQQPQSSEPETRSDCDDKDRVSSSSFAQQHDRDDDHDVQQLHSVVAHAAIEPFDTKHIGDDDDNEADHNSDENSSTGGGGDTGRSEEKPPAPAASLQQQQQHEQEQDDADEEVFASDYKSGASAENDYSDDEDDDDEEEKLEVFDDNDAGNQHHASHKRHHHHREQHNEPETQVGPDTMDLVVVGLSPLKLTRPVPQPSSPARTAAVPPAVSPVAKTQALESPRRAVMECAPPLEAPVALPQPTTAVAVDETKQSEAVPLEPKRRGGIKVDLEQDDVARGSSTTSSALERPVLKAPPQLSSARGGPPASKKTEQSVVPVSPEKPPRLQLQTQPLLSDFHFGSELGPTAVRQSALDSPAKRRGAISASTLSPSSSSSPSTSLAAAVMPTRKSFARDQEQQLGMASPKKRVTMARSSMALSKSSGAATAASGSSATLANDLPREALEGIQEETKRPSSPRKTSVSRRRSSSMMEAPILASAFMASTVAVDDPASHEDDGDDGPLEHRQGSASSSHANAANDTDSATHDAATAFAFDAVTAIAQEFGERVARLLSAEPWGDRQDGFDAIQYIVKKADLSATKTKRELFCAALAAIQGGVDDRVAPVMYCALECLRTVLKEFAPVVDRTFLRYAPMNEQLSALIKSLVGKLGDSNKRTQRETSQALLRVTKQKKLKALPHVLLHLSAKEVAPRLQVETLRQLVSALGVDSKNGLSLGVAMQFAIPALKVADEKTRKAAVELIADLHMLNGEAVNAQLVGTKPEMLRVINRRVDELLAKREQEKEAAAQSANQTEDGAGGDDDLEKGAELVAVPAEEAKKTIALLEAQVLQAASVIGPVAWRKLESKTWSDRKEALVDIEKVMTEAKSDLRDAKPAFGSVIQLNFLAYCVTVHKCLGDSIAPVVNSAMDCLSTLIKVFGPCVEWREESVRDVVLLTIMRLFSTMQKPNSRTNRAACRSILKFARLTNAHTLRYTLSCIFAKETDALVQMHLLRLLIPEFGFQTDGISAALVLAAVGAALVHANDKVRKTAIDVALCTQRLVGKEYVLKKLKDVKPVTLKELEKNFVECDIKKDSDRPQTVHMSTSGATSDAGLPPVHFGGGENARRLLNSAPVGVGKLYCTPSSQDDDAFGSSTRRGSVLSNEEENFMDSILDGDL